MWTTTAAKAPAQLPTIANFAIRGEPTVITRQGKPVAIVGPIIETRRETGGFLAYVRGFEGVCERGQTEEEAVGALWKSLKNRPFAQEREVARAEA